MAVSTQQYTMPSAPAEDTGGRIIFSSPTQPDLSFYSRPGAGGDTNACVAQRDHLTSMIMAKHARCARHMRWLVCPPVPWPPVKCNTKTMCLGLTFTCRRVLFERFREMAGTRGFDQICISLQASCVSIYSSRTRKSVLYVSVYMRPEGSHKTR